MFERGELLLVPYPFSDLSAAKRRPVVAVTEPDRYGDFIAFPVTSRPQGEHGIPLVPRELVRGTLPAPSWIRTDRIVTLSATLIVKSVGRVSDRALAAAVDRFCGYIGFAKAAPPARP
jgi:mRNA interferase MazF